MTPHEAKVWIEARDRRSKWEIWHQAMLPNAKKPVPLWEFMGDPRPRQDTRAMRAAFEAGIKAPVSKR